MYTAALVDPKISASLILPREAVWRWSVSGPSLRVTGFEDSLPDIASRLARHSFPEFGRRSDVGSFRRRGEVGRTSTKRLVSIRGVLARPHRYAKRRGRECGSTVPSPNRTRVAGWKCFRAGSALFSPTFLTRVHTHFYVLRSWEATVYKAFTTPKN
jgi:hypothetical protein